MRIIISIDVFILGSEIRSARPLAGLWPAGGRAGRARFGHRRRRNAASETDKKINVQTYSIIVR